VYFAISGSGKEVALKRIARNLEVELRGVRQCLNLKHPNLIDLWDIQVDDMGESWVVMEYVAGPSLKDVIAEHPQGMDLDAVCWWFQGISAGVHYLHQNGIVHRDLKPGNIFHDTEAELVKIGDYGLSKFISCSRRSGHTESVGTVHYMAPEIGRGIYGREIDVYSLGIILHELLTGNLPFDGETTQEIIMKHLTATPDLSALSDTFRPVVLKALAKDPEQRYRTVWDMLSDLPAEFWPPSLKRVARAPLSETLARPSGNPSQPHGSAGASAARTPQGESEPGGDAPASHSLESAVQERRIVSDATTAATSVAANPQIQPLLGRHRFNQPPAPVLPASRSDLTPGALGEAANRSGAASALEQSPRAEVGPSLQEKFSRTSAEIVFGEVTFHDVVEAEMVFSDTTARLAPVDFGTSAAQEPRSLAPPAPTASQPLGKLEGRLLAEPRLRPRLSRAERSVIKDDPRVQRAAAQYLQRISGADQLAALLGGMLTAAVVAAVATGIVAAMTLNDSMLPSQRDDVLAILVWFWLCSFSAPWVVLSVSRLWAATDQQTGWLRWSYLPLSLGIAGFAWGAATGLEIDFSSVLLTRNFLDQGAIGSLLFFDHQPRWVAFVLFSCGLVYFGGWAKQTNPLRLKRIRWTRVLWTAGVALVLGCLLNFDWKFAACLGATVSLSTQLAAPYFSDRQRCEVRDLAASGI
jgi:serine/threonine protein kinase